MPTVLDNMIHEGQIPPTAALFIAPGTVGDGYPVWGRLAALDNRSTELDAADERYANFLCDEVIPFALKDIVLADDPRKRAIWGVSSGGAASLTACWHRSDQIGTALMACSSVAIMRMAGLLQFALRNQPRKDIQVVLMAANMTTRRPPGATGPLSAKWLGSRWRSTIISISTWYQRAGIPMSGPRGSRRRSCGLSGWGRNSVAPMWKSAPEMGYNFRVYPDRRLLCRTSPCGLLRIRD